MVPFFFGLHWKIFSTLLGLSSGSPWLRERDGGPDLVGLRLLDWPESGPQSI